MSAANEKPVPELTRAQVLANIRYLTETNIKIRYAFADQTQLCPDMTNIIMDYFEGMYADEIMHIWDTLHANSGDNNNKLSFAIIDFKKFMQTPAERQQEYEESKIYAIRLSRICGLPEPSQELLDKLTVYPADDAGQEIFREIVDNLGLQTRHIPRLDDEIANYIISIYHTMKSTGSDRVPPNYIISLDSMSAIYILVCAISWRADADESRARPLMPVWDYYSSRFVQYKKLNAKLQI